MRQQSCNRERLLVASTNWLGLYGHGLPIPGWADRFEFGNWLEHSVGEFKLSISSDNPVFISGAAVRSVFEWTDAIRALQTVYARDLDPESIPPRTIAESDRAWLRALPAAPTGSRYYGAKLMAMALGAAKPACEYVVVLFDKESSRVAAFIDGNLLTGLRTAATTAAAIDRLAPERPLRLGVIGTGLEASMHTRAFAAIRDLAEIVAYSPTPEKRSAFAEAVARDLGKPARAADSAREAIADADLVLCAARSRGEVPLLYADWIKPGSTIVSIGSTVPVQREIDVSVIDRADLIVCDNLDEVVHDTGDMIAAAKEGIDVRGKSFAMHDLLSGKIEQERKLASMPLYKSVGGGLQDIVVAEMILVKALELGLAQPLPFSFESKFL